MTVKINRQQGSESGFPRLLGERLCLDFANSIENPLQEPEEFLTDFAALARWGSHAGLLDEAEVATAIKATVTQPEMAASCYGDALALRASIQRVFLAIAESRDVNHEDLAGIQQAYLRGTGQSQLVIPGDRATWEWAGGGELGEVEFVLWRVAQSAVDLLTEGDLRRVKTCGCGWLFYDTSRNGSRRWCSMEGCGSQAKMRRFTEKRRAARA